MLAGTAEKKWRMSFVQSYIKGGLHQPHLNRHLANGHLTVSSH